MQTTMTKNYSTTQLLNYLKYLSMSIDRSEFQCNTDCVNHLSAINFPNDVDVYFRKETKHKPIVFPCDSIPFPICYSPILSRPKEGDTRRIIINIVDDIVKSVQDLGTEVLLSKIDVSGAFKTAFKTFKSRPL